MSEYEQLKLENQLCHAIYIASNALARSYKPLLDPLGITYPQYLIMLVLWENDGISISQISKLTFFDSGTLTPLLHKLQERGYVQLEVQAHDRRLKLVRLTPEGEALKHKASKVPDAMICLLPFNGDQIDEFRKMARILHQSLLHHEQS